MAANDDRGRDVLEACRAANLGVPEEVAVVGVDNDSLIVRIGQSGPLQRGPSTPNTAVLKRPPCSIA